MRTPFVVSNSPSRAQCLSGLHAVRYFAAEKLVSQPTVETFCVPVLNTAICQRVALAESAAQGQVVLETESESTAAKEIRQLVTEIGEFM